MLEWLICAAGVATHVGSEPGVAAQAESAEDFFEFLAEWDEADLESGASDPPADADSLEEQESEDRRNLSSRDLRGVRP